MAEQRANPYTPPQADLDTQNQHTAVHELRAWLQFSRSGMGLIQLSILLTVGVTALASVAVYFLFFQGGSPAPTSDAAEVLTFGSKLISLMLLPVFGAGIFKTTAAGPLPQSCLPRRIARLTFGVHAALIVVAATLKVIALAGGEVPSALLHLERWVGPAWWVCVAAAVWHLRPLRHHIQTKEVTLITSAVLFLCLSWVDLLAWQTHNQFRGAMTLLGSVGVLMILWRLRRNIKSALAHLPDGQPN